MNQKVGVSIPVQSTRQISLGKMLTPSCSLMQPVIRFSLICVNASKRQETERTNWI